MASSPNVVFVATETPALRAGVSASSTAKVAGLRPATFAPSFTAETPALRAGVSASPAAKLPASEIAPPHAAAGRSAGSFVHPDVTIYCLLSWLTILDVYALFRAIPPLVHAYKQRHRLARTDNAFKHVFITRLEASLVSFYGKYNGDMCFRHLKLHNMALTGGFLLAVLNNDPIQACEDADFIITYDHTLGFEKFCKRSDDVCGTFKNVTLAPEITCDASYSNAFCVETLVTDNKKHLQLIWLSENNDAYEQFVKNFDFGFCANYFNWEKLVVMKKQNLQERFCAVQLMDCYGGDLTKLPRKWQRICKYRKRGYQIRLEQRELFPNFKNADAWNEFWRDKI